MFPAEGLRIINSNKNTVKPLYETCLPPVHIFERARIVHNKSKYREDSCMRLNLLFSYSFFTITIAFFEQLACFRTIAEPLVILMRLLKLFRNKLIHRQKLQPTIAKYPGIRII